jgi:DNA modification methylase
MDVPYKLYKGDCLEIMPQLEAGSVDAIITDLPYGTTRCSWDEVIPLKEMWKQVKRVLKSSGVFVTTSSQPFTTVLVYSNLKGFRCEWIWNKNKAGNIMLAKKQPLKIHENIVVFGGAKYNPQMTKNPFMRDIRKEKSKQNRDDGAVTPKGFIKYADDYDPSLKYPVSIQNFVNHRELDDVFHPTQKPVDLYRYLIRTYTNPNETVLDIAMGSGTTGIAAISEGRSFIGIEKEQVYYSIAEKRIKQAAQQPALFHATQQSVQRTGGESGQQNLFSAGEVLPAKVTRQSTRR